MEKICTYLIKLSKQWLFFCNWERLEPLECHLLVRVIINKALAPFLFRVIPVTMMGN